MMNGMLSLAHLPAKEDLSRTLTDVIVGGLAVGASLTIIMVIHAATGAPRGLGFIFPVAVVLVARLVGFSAALWTAGIGSLAFAAFVVPQADNTIDAHGLTATLICMLAIAYLDAWRPRRRVTVFSGWLPFVSRDGGERRSFWSVDSTGHYLADVEAGQQAAAECLHAMRSGRQSYLLVWTVRDMIEKGRFSGVEVGFLGALGTALVDDDARNDELRDGIVQALDHVAAGAVGHE